MAKLVREGDDGECAHSWYQSPGAATASHRWLHHASDHTSAATEAGSVRLTGLIEDRFDGHVLVKTKARRRALYYDLDVSCEWEGRHISTGNTLRGVIRVYNVAQDTQFCPGGDTGTSYMYEISRQQVAGGNVAGAAGWVDEVMDCLLYTSPSPRDATLSRMPSSA